jgi:hypothetical protein
MITLVQIRERKECRQHHNLETLPVINVEPSEVVERLRCGAGLDIPVQIVV